MEANVSPDSPLRSMSTNVTAPSPLRKSTSAASSEWSKTSGSSTLSGPASSFRQQTYSLGSISNSSVSTAPTVRPISGSTRPMAPLGASNSSSSLDKTMGRSPLSPTKHGAPRIGLRSSQSHATSSTNRRSDVTKQFKPPLMNPPTRCSPRRHPPPGAPANRTPVRNSAGMARHKDGTTLRSDNVPTLPPVKRGKEPSSDGPTTGDESFDSFDGMFELGGEDVERLLSVVDGST
jgi:hypothetical protein